MKTTTTKPKTAEEAADKTHRPSQLSYSRISRYLHCPEQYRLYYVEGLRPRYPAASLVFGQILHQALARLFRERGDPVQFFERLWSEARDYDLTYSQRESWEKLREIGRKLLERFLREEFPRLGAIRAAEKTFEINVSGLDAPFTGVIDLVAELDGRPTVIDFKTASTAYQAHEVALSDQLTAYRLAEPAVNRAALCVLVKTKEPRIEWHLTERQPHQLVEFLSKAGYIVGEIAAGRFYKRPGKWCSWCDYVAVCAGDHQRAEQTLVRIQ